MAFPSDVSLSANAKYFGFIDSKKAYDLNWDIVWSFTYALTGTQHGFCTFLTTSASLLSGIPGQYLGYLGNYSSAHILGIAFDSTGYFALTNTCCSEGIPLSSTNRDSLIIRDSGTKIIYNSPLSSLDTSFILASSVKQFKTLRFRYVNGGKKLYIDYRRDDDSYKNLLTLAISTLNLSAYSKVYAGLTFCSPISGLSATPSTMYVKNFHTQGNISNPTYETLSFTSLSSSITSFTTISTLLSSFD